MEACKTRREYPDSPVAAVAAVVLSDEGVLLTLRGNEPSKGTWGLPGGVVELGEAVQEAIVREVEEETGIRVRPERLITVFDRVVRDGDGRIRFHYVLCEYLCTAISGALRASSDVTDAAWIPLDGLDSFDVSTGTRRFIEKARAPRATSSSKP